MNRSPRVGDKVLIVDDSRESRVFIKEAVRGIFEELIEAEDGITALKAFVENRPTFIITDVEMPSVNGYRFISTVREMEDGKDIPIIMYSATKHSIKDKLEGFSLGTSDFLVKPFEPEEIAARIRYLLKMRDLVRELREKNALLEQLAVTDPLTGLYNRRHFFDAMKEHMALSMRHRFNIACLIMDIDHFKAINDTWGHSAGDDILRKFGSLLNSRRREGELLARYGGEEFAICLFNTGPDKAYQAGERFRNLVRDYGFSSPHYPPLQVTVSIGIAIYPLDGILTPDDLVRAADSALYMAKGEGRDKVVLYNPSMLKKTGSSSEPF